MPAIDWKLAIAYAQLVGLAYKIPPAQPYNDDVKAQIKAAGYDFVLPIYGYELATDASPHTGEVVTFGYLAKSPSGELVAAIRGTETILEWIHDAAFLFVPNPIHAGGGLTEDGFTAIYRSLRAGDDPNSPTVIDTITALVGAGGVSRVTICGHSLGAAVATLLALDAGLNSGCKSVAAYTYASPRVGELFFQHTYDSVVPNSFRVHHRPDVVPKVPFYPFEHIGLDLEVISPFDTVNTDLACWHSLDTYLWLMDREAGGNTLKVDDQCQGPQYPGPR
jgi:Lipase (class 3)